MRVNRFRDRFGASKVIIGMIHLPPLPGYPDSPGIERILRQATGDNGRLMQLAGPRNPYQAGPLGVIEPGAYADILLVKGNPLDDLSLMTDPDKNFDLIMKGGQIYKNKI